MSSANLIFFLLANINNGNTQHHIVSSYISLNEPRLLLLNKLLNIFVSNISFSNTESPPTIKHSYKRFRLEVSCKIRESLIAIKRDIFICGLTQR